MILTKTYSYRLYSSKRNARLHQQINIAGCVYNHCIALHKRYYRRYKKHLSAFRLKKHVTQLKKQPRFAFWNGLGSQAIQDVCERIDRAYTLFFRTLKKGGRKTAPPGFKKVKKYSSFTLKQAGWKLLDDNKIRIGDTVYKYAKSREIVGRIQIVTIKRTALNQLCLYVVVKQSVPSKNARDYSRVCGFDFGLSQFLTPSNGTPIDAPLFYREGQTAVRHANRTVSRKVEGSKSYRRAKRQLARIHTRIANCRKDYHFKLAHRLTNAYDVLVFETLNIAGMKRRWGKKVSDLAFSQFMTIVSYVAAAKGVTVWQLNQWQPTTKPCSVCGYMNQTLTLADRQWTCPRCQTHHERDKNAAINIERLGRQAMGRDGVRPVATSATVA